MIRSFVEKLSQVEPQGSFTNQYHQRWEHSDLARENLVRYLEVMEQIAPSVLLVGEAPGHKGCRLTGVPFTSERNLTQTYSHFGLFGAENGFRIRDQGRPQTEASATIVWGVLRDLDFFPLIWNAFPFHPHQPDNLNSNRPPTSDELAIGKAVLLDLLTMFGIRKVVSVGKTANQTLDRLGVQNEMVRHPSMGGKTDFVAAMLGLRNAGSI